MKVYFDQTVIDDECNIDKVTYHEVETNDVNEYIRLLNLPNWYGYTDER